MIRFLLWFLLILVVLRFIRLAFGGHRTNTAPRTSHPGRSENGSFDHIQDADFEDLTPKPPPPSQ